MRPFKATYRRRASPLLSCAPPPRGCGPFPLPPRRFGRWAVACRVSPVRLAGSLLSGGAPSPFSSVAVVPALSVGWARRLAWWSPAPADFAGPLPAPPWLALVGARALALRLRGSPPGFAARPLVGLVGAPPLGLPSRVGVLFRAGCRAPCPLASAPLGTAPLCRKVLRPVQGLRHCIYRGSSGVIVIEPLSDGVQIAALG